MARPQRGLSLERPARIPSVRTGPGAPRADTEPGRPGVPHTGSTSFNQEGAGSSLVFHQVPKILLRFRCGTGGRGRNQALGQAPPWACMPSSDIRLVECGGGRLGSQGCPPADPARPPHPRKSFTSSTVMSPVVSRVVSALVAESMDIGESVASGSSGVSAGRD